MHSFTRSRLLPTALTCAALASAARGQDTSVAVEVLPDPVFIEAGKSRQHLNFDFRLHNFGTTPVQVTRIELSVFDSQDELEQVLFIDRGGTAPGLDSFIPGPVPGTGTLYVFNPYHDWDTEVELARLEYVFTFARTGLPPQTAKATVRPRTFVQQARLRLPLDGRILVQDGHDYLSHHRRVDLDLPALASANMTANSNRYAYDFVVVDESGSMYPPGKRALQDCYGWGAPVLAPAAGRVVAAVGDFPDNTVTASGGVRQSTRVTVQDIETFAGNFVLLDHGNGEYSTLGHLQSGSLTVEVDEVVERGQVLGAMGLSGATSAVHLHYQLQAGTSFGGSEGLPSRFHDYLWHLGSRSVTVELGQVDSGDIVEALPPTRSGQR